MASLDNVLKLELEAKEAILNALIKSAAGGHGAEEAKHYAEAYNLINDAAPLMGR
jgi:hypothetical protein